MVERHAHCPPPTVSFFAIPYDRAIPRVPGHDEQWVLEGIDHSYRHSLPSTATERAVSSLKAFARCFARCILHTRIHHEYNYYLEWREVSQRHFPGSMTIIKADAEDDELMDG
jgi:hypothetical protein